MLFLALLAGQLTILEFIAILVGIILGVTVHEFAHAYVADRLGDPTARYEGRVSLNPFAHLDLAGTIMLLTVGFGWGRPVPINPRNFSDKNSELKVAFAGIITNIFVAFLLAIPIRFALMMGQTIESSSLLIFLDRMIEINLVLATFNFIPIPPLDGSHLVEHFLSEEKKYVFQTVGPSILIGLIVIGFISNFSIFQYVVEPLTRLLSAIVEGTYSIHF